MREQRRMNPDEKIKYRKLYDGGLRWQQLADRINGDITTSYTKSQVRDMLKRVTVTQGAGNVGNGQEKRPTLVFSDLHLPYHREGYLEFLKETHKKYNCKELVICVGDLADHHAISRFKSEPDAMGDAHEMSEAYAEIQKLVKVFPNAVITLGNHDLIAFRQAAEMGLSTRYMKSFEQLWDLPDTWNVVDEIIIDDVLYSHGVGSGGKDGAINKAMSEQMSNVQGHYHAFGGCKYIANKRNLIFGLNTGCLCDPNSIAMAYGKHSKYRPTLGCGVVYNKNQATFVPWIL